MRFLRRKATVKGPMPPGVGVMREALPRREGSSKSPQIVGSWWPPPERGPAEAGFVVSSIIPTP